MAQKEASCYQYPRSGAVRYDQRVDCAQSGHAVSLPVRSAFLSEDCLSEASSAAADLTGKRVSGHNRPAGHTSQPLSAGIDNSLPAAFSGINKPNELPITTRSANKTDG